jgi:hypothetical protein
MTNEVACELVNDTFSGLKQATTISEVRNLLNHDSIQKKFRSKSEKYPPLSFNISKDDIDELTERKSLGDWNNIPLTNLIDGATTLEKLLLAMIWKQGDLMKVKHIVDGIRNVNQDGKSGQVFRQFGRFLNDPENEPIIDQHVLRAFRVDDLTMNRSSVIDFNEHAISKARSSSILTSSDHADIEKYKQWMRTGLNSTLRSIPGYMSAVDDVCFAVGKAIKWEWPEKIY